MVGGRHIAGRTLDQRGKVLAGEHADLDAKALGLQIELRPVGEAPGRRVKEPKQAAWRTSTLYSAAIMPPTFAGPGHSHNRMTLAIYARATDGMQDSATTAQEEAVSRSGC